ncbi:MAG: porin [Oxalobacteraceae bacterium]|nr:porin [Oxalobacteraceae bacterium]
MKTKLLAGLVASCFAAPALAQSNITIYGLMDAGLHVSSNGEGTKTKLVSGIADGSRLGFKGSEDLGGGYKAIFNIEARIELDTGGNQAGNISNNQGFALTRGMDPLGPILLPRVRAALQPAINVNTNRALFDRTSMVGLITPVGAILAGRMYTPAYEVFAAADTFETGTAGSWGGVALGSGGLLTAGIAIRSDKALQYRIQLPNGISAALMYGFKNSGYIGLDDQFWAANVMYKANGFNLGLGHNYGTDQNGDKGLVTTTLGGSYQTGAMKFFAGYQAMKNDNSVLIPVASAQVAQGLVGLPAPQVAAIMSILNTNLERNFKLDADSISVGMHYTIGSGRVMGSVSHQNDKTSFNNDVTQYAIGYDHNLSKRTDIYTVLAYIKNKNDAQYAPGAASAPGGFTSEPGQAGRAFQVGMRHRF